MDFDGISRPVTQLIDAGALVVFVPSLLLAVLLSGPFARRWGTSRWLTALALASVAGIIAATLRERDLLLWSEDIGAILACVGCDRFGWLTDADLWSGVTQVQVGWLLNVALFVPAGILLTLASGRPRRVLVGLIGLSFAIEVIQDLTFLGAPDPADLVANALGAVIGVSFAVFARYLSRRWSGGSTQTSLSRRAMVMRLAVVVAVVAVGWLGLQAGADVRRDTLRNEIQTAFAGTAASDVDAKMASESGFDELLDAITTRPMYLGRVGESDQFEALYTSQFFGSYRCVTIRWDANGFSLSDGAGDTCTVFRDRPPEE